METRERVTDLLAEDHRELDRVFDALLDAFHANVRDEAYRLWAAFDDGLGRHMTLEEARVLPALRRREPDEAAALLEEHREIRESLADLGVSIERERLTTRAVHEFNGQLRRHRRREEALAYRCADELLSASDNQQLRTGLAKSSSLRRRLSGLGAKPPTVPCDSRAVAGRDHGISASSAPISSSTLTGFVR